MKATIAALSFALFAGSAQAQSNTGSSAKWVVQNYQLSTVLAPNAIDLTPSSFAEMVTVYGKRHKRTASTQEQSILILGNVALNGTDSVHMAGFSGMTVTASMPIMGVPGLEGDLNLSGGHDTSNPASSPAAAALTAGIKLKF